jgi:hypothetical protein
MRWWWCWPLGQSHIPSPWTWLQGTLVNFRTLHNTSIIPNAIGIILLGKHSSQHLSFTLKLHSQPFMGTGPCVPTLLLEQANCDLYMLVTADVIPGYT